jgi:selenocysteine lyase/cysteine desulfurase
LIAEALAAENIYCWSGHNYAYEAALLLGLDENEGVVRLGIAHYNTQAEIEQALSAIEKIITSYAH